MQRKTSHEDRLRATIDKSLPTYHLDIQREREVVETVRHSSSGTSKPKSKPGHEDTLRDSINNITVEIEGLDNQRGGQVENKPSEKGRHRD